ncbi:(Fe-S)-binding protein [Ectothiorhodospiraceae bacterium WFHF3C12]|nr:(Fe-S)-binding protein [Ectothiorhodospiraceae bacterium WFHF3C12]
MSDYEDTARPANPHVGLFVTCLVDLFRPSVGFASLALLEQAGCTVTVPRAQTCCGQPTLNSGDTDDTRAIARQVIRAFEAFDYVVGPSGSCLATVQKDYPGLFEEEQDWRHRAEALARRCYELTSFLVDVMGLEEVPGVLQGHAAYHDSCSGLRQLGVREQPRSLLAGVDELAVSDLDSAEVCCGFGGTFCVKYPEISAKMADDKIAAVERTGADILLGGDLGCLMHLSGRLKRLGKPTRVYHVAEVLADMTDGAGIGDPER